MLEDHKLSYLSFMFDLSNQDTISYSDGRTDYYKLTLLDRKSNDSEGYTAICYACANGVPSDNIKHLIGLEFTLEECNRGKTPLQYACQCMSADTVKVLLANSTISVTSSDILAAASLTDSSILEAMLYHIASDNTVNIASYINAKDKYGNTPLILACMSQCYGSVETLLEKKADKCVRNKDGKTALDIAIENNDKGLRSKLQSTHQPYIHVDAEDNYNDSTLKRIIDDKCYICLNSLEFNSYEKSKIKNTTSLDNDKLPEDLRHA